MALAKSKIDVIFTKGVNTKSDSRNTLGADLLALENRVFNKLGAVNKRFGFDSLGDRICGTGVDITNFSALTTYNTKSLILMANNKLYDYSQSSDDWIEKDGIESASIKLDTIVSNATEQTEPSTVAHKGLIATVWKDSGGSVRYSLQDDSTGSFFVVNEEIASSGVHPNVVGIGSSLLFTYVTGSNLAFKIVSAGNPCGGFSSTGNIRTDLAAAGIYDIINVGNVGFCSYKNSSNNLVTVEISTTGGVSNVKSTSLPIDDVVSIYAYEHTTNGTTSLTVGYKETSSLVKVVVYSQGLVELVATQTVDATSSTDITKMIAIQTDITLNEVTLFWQVPGSAASDDFIKSRTLSIAGTLGTAGTFLRSVGIATKGFNGPNGGMFFNVLHESALQATVFTVNGSAEILCKFAAGNAGTQTAISTTPSHVSTSASGKFLFAINTKGVIRSENATLFSLLGVSIGSIDFASQNIFSDVGLNSNLFVVGGVLNVYDGKQVTEQGFNVFPEGIINQATAGTGGFMSDGTYLYRAVYRWVDGQNNIHTSAPSEPLSVVLSGGGALQTKTIRIPTLRLTRKGATNVTIELFRTEASGTIFHKVTSISSPSFNDTTIDVVDIVDTLADASIISNEILYTSGGILDNIAAPSCDIVITHGNRLFIAGLQNKNEVRFSKIVRTGEGVTFNELLSIVVDPAGGPITNLASMDSNLVIFKGDNIYRVSGGGPSDTGAGTTFSDPELIATDVGCVDVNSLVLGPNGLYFKSSKGIYLLNRSLEASYIGAQVEEFNSDTITSAVLSEDVNEVRFTSESGNILVHNYYFGQWSVFTNKEILDSTIWNSLHTYIDNSGNIASESKTSYKDLGSFVTSKVATGWIRTGSLAGYQRTWRVGVLGEFKSDHKLQITVYSDYSLIPDQVKIIDTADFLGTDEDFYGDEVYGDSTPYGGSSNGVYEFQVHLKKQKAQSVRFVIEDIFENSDITNTGQGMSLTGIQLEIGTKKGINKLGKAKKG